MVMHRWFAATVALAVVACKFASDGLGEHGAAADGTTTGASSATDVSPTTTAVTTGDATGDGDTGTSTTAAPPEHCGDGTIDPGEACDDGDDNGADRPCTPVCGVNFCGDGYALAAVEACDDGNDDDTDACARCQPAVCGDGWVYKNVESCDGAGASADCDVDCSAASCGDGTVNRAAGEQCDLGSANGLYASGCNDGCDGPGPSCGDGTVDVPDEVCDPGAALPDHEACVQDCKAFGCQEHWDDCNGDAADGCEVDLRTDIDNCGECDNDCVAPKCDDGKCHF